MDHTRPRIAALLSAAVPVATFAALAAAPPASGTAAASARTAHAVVAPRDECNSTIGIRAMKWPLCVGD